MERPRLLSSPDVTSNLVPLSNTTHSAGSYSFFDEFPHCLFPPPSQGRCQYCYALAVAAVLSHRTCRSSGSLIYLNPLDVVHCSSHVLGCNLGGHEYLAWRYAEYTGFPNVSCAPYSTSEYKCKASQSCDKYLSNYGSTRTFVGEDEIRNEIRKNGPVTAVFQMMDDFSTYSGGVYQSDSDEPGQFHSIEIVGWGEEDGTPYWLAQNSFGDLWGLNGLFKILRGSNHLGIESYATAARPNPT